MKFYTAENTINILKNGPSSRHLNVSDNCFRDYVLDENGKAIRVDPLELPLNEDLFYIRENVYNSRSEVPNKGSFYSTDTTWISDFDSIDHAAFLDDFELYGYEETEELYFSKYVLTLWENTRWGSKKQYDTDHYIPSNADFSAPVEVGIDIFNLVDQIYGVFNSTFTITEKRYFDMLLKATKNNRYKGYIVLTYHGKVKAISLDSSTKIITGVHIFSSIDDFELAYKEVQDHIKERLKRAKLKFAQMCTEKAKKHEIPFDVALAFKGSDDKITLFIYSLNRVISEQIDVNFGELKLGRKRAKEEIDRLGILIDTVDPNRLKNYIYSCLKEGKILKK